MTVERDVGRVLEHWLVDGVDEMPDRVYLSILDRVERQPQRRAWRVSWRDSTVNAYLKPILAVAAAIVLAVAGFAVLGRPMSQVGGPGPASPAPLPTPTQSPPPLPDGTLAAGQYVAHAVAGDSMAFTLTAPAGWTGLGGWFVGGPRGPAGPAGIGTAFLHGPRTVDDPCLYDQSPGLTPSGAPGTASVDDIVAELSAFGGGQVASVTDATLAGSQGKEVDLQLPATLPCGQYYVFAEPQGLYAQGPSNRWRIFLVDVGGTTAVVVLSDFAATAAADRTAAQGILDSLMITP